MKEKLDSETPKTLVSATPLPPISIIIACNLGIKAPPTMGITKGFRSDDLNRWRAHNLFDGDQPRGAFHNDGAVNTLPTPVPLDADLFLLPFPSFSNFNFDESRAYLQPIPLDQLQLNPNLTQNPSWE